MMKKGNGWADHESCCLFSPETYLISLELVSLPTKYIVPDVRQVFDNKSKTTIFRKKLDEDAMLCNTLWSDRRRLITKNISFCVLLNVGIDPNFPQKSFFFHFRLYSEKNFAFQRKHF